MILYKNEAKIVKTKMALVNIFLITAGKWIRNRKRAVSKGPFII